MSGGERRWGLVELVESDVAGVLAEAATAEEEAVLPDEAVAVEAHAAANTATIIPLPLLRAPSQRSSSSCQRLPSSSYIATTSNYVLQRQLTIQDRYR